MEAAIRINMDIISIVRRWSSGNYYLFYERFIGERGLILPGRMKNLRKKLIS